jgi:N-acetylglucosamine kinase-like BadF-type ATPase
VTEPVVLAVDGGASKTDLALVGADGSLLALERGPHTSPHHIGLDGCLAVLDDLLAAAGAAAGLDGVRPHVAHLLLAGADLPEEEAALQAATDARGWAARTVVQNDTFALLRAGTEAGWGVAVVCGAGINCVGVAPDGRVVRFLSLGAITGDWGGGHDVGLAAVSAAARSADGRGQRTVLEDAVPSHFGLTTPDELAEALHVGRIPSRRVLELPPLVFASAERDEVAAGIVDRLACEVAAFARAAITRLDLRGEAVEVLLGGGLMRGAGRRLLDRVAEDLRAVGPAVTARVVPDAPIVGAALLGLDDVGAGPDARARARRELAEAVAGIRVDGDRVLGSVSDG